MRDSDRPQILSTWGIHTKMKGKEKASEQKTPTREELIQDVQSMILMTNYRQIWMIHNFVKSVLRPGD